MHDVASELTHSKNCSEAPKDNIIDTKFPDLCVCFTVEGRSRDETLPVRVGRQEKNHVAWYLISVVYLLHDEGACW